MRVLIDDVRSFDSMDETLRTPQEARDFISKHGKEIDTLFIDHDLGSEKDDGYKILSDMFENGIFPKTVLMVSANPVGIANMTRALEYYGYRRGWTPVRYTRME